MKIISILLGCLLGVVRLTAAESVVITMDGVGDRVRSQNPQLKSARLLIAEAIGRARDAGRLSNPTWESSLEAGPGLEERNVDMGLAQAFPVTGRLRLQKKISVLEIKEAEAEVNHVQQQLIASARAIAIELLALRERRSLLQQQATLNAELIAYLRDATSKGESSALDLGQAQLESNQITLELARLTADAITLDGQLKQLLGMKPAAAVVLGGTLPEPVALLEDPMIENRPDYHAARIRAEAAQRGVELEQARRMDDIELGVFASSMSREDAPDGIQSDRMLGVRLSIPLPLWNRNQGAIDEAGARHQRRQLEADAIRHALSVQHETTRTEMRHWRQWLVEINDKLLPLARQQVALADQSYRAGETEIQTLLSAREQVLELLVARLDGLRQYHIARVRYPMVDLSNSTPSENEN